MDYYHISAQELGKGAKLPILKLGDSGEVFYEMAAEMCAAIRANNAAGKPTVFICPVGPVGQYPIFVRLVNREQLLPEELLVHQHGRVPHRRRPVDRRGESPVLPGLHGPGGIWQGIAPELLMPEEQRVFPDPTTWAASPP